MKYAPVWLAFLLSPLPDDISFNGWRESTNLPMAVYQGLVAGHGARSVYVLQNPTFGPVLARNAVL